MKILFVAPNQGYPYPRPPLGLLSVATVAKADGHEVKILDLNLYGLSMDGVLEIASAFEIIGLTAMTPTAYDAVELARNIKRAYPDKYIVLGGVHASIFSRDCYNLGVFDIVVEGEGELPMLDILSKLRQGNRLCGVYPRLGNPDLDRLPIPDYSLLEVNRYIPRYPHGFYQGVRVPWTCASTSRGCPYKCTFCSKAVSGNS